MFGGINPQHSSRCSKQRHRICRPSPLCIIAIAPDLTAATSQVLGGSMRRRFASAVILILLTSAACACAETNPAMKGSFRKPAQNGWTYVHLEGKPYEIGFQHGYLLADEILDAEKVVALEQTHHSKRNWDFFRNAARDTMWPHIEQEYREELQGV